MSAFAELTHVCNADEIGLKVGKLVQRFVDRFYRAVLFGRKNLERKNSVVILEQFTNFHMIPRSFFGFEFCQSLGELRGA